MSKYIKLEDALEALMCYFVPPIYTGEQVDQAKNIAKSIMNGVPTIEVSEDCISRVETLATLNAMMRVDSDNVNVYSKVFSQIKDAPMVVPSRETGKWVAADDDENIMFAVYKCSRCGNILGSSPHNYCPNCGARMEG